MEALQMLKFGLRTELFDFTSHLLTPEDDLTLGMGSAPDFLAELMNAGDADASREDVMDKIIREIED